MSPVTFSIAFVAVESLSNDILPGALECNIQDLVLIDGVRTPMAEFNGPFADLSAIELGARAAKALFERTGIDPAAIDHTVVGNALQTSVDAIYGARHVALKAGVPKEVPALTVNRLCGSGIQAIVSGLAPDPRRRGAGPAWSAAWRTCRRRRTSCAARARGCGSATPSSTICSGSR